MTAKCLFYLSTHYTELTWEEQKKKKKILEPNKKKKKGAEVKMGGNEKW